MKRPIQYTVACCLTLACASAWGQASTPPTAGGYTISGVVLNERTGQVIPKVMMSLSDAVKRRSVADFITDAQGNFRFDHLPPGRYALGAQRRGFVPQAFQQHAGGVSTAIVTGEGKPSTGLRFTLKQQASIFGSITEDSGDPVPRARVLLFRKEEVSGAEKVVRAGQAVADEVGDYEITRLTPGKYYLCATGTPWYAERMRMAQAADAPRSPLDVAYALTCYPGVTDPAEAELLDLTAGDRLELPLTFHPEPAVHLVLPMPENRNNRALNMPGFNVQIFGTTEFAPPSSISILRDPNAQHRVMQITASVAPGQYQVMFQGQNGDAARVMQVDASAETVPLDPAEAAQESGVSGKVTMNNGAPLPRAGVFLVPENGDPYVGGVLPTGDFRIPTLPPGNYAVRVESEAGRLGVAQMTAKGALLHAGVLKIGSDPVTLQLSVFEGNGTVTGVVQRGDTTASGVFVLLVPNDRSAPAIANQSDSDGSFEYQHVLPGTYIAVAIEDGWTLNWSSRDVLEHYLAGGEKITVPNAAHELSLPVPLQTQAK